MKYLLALALLSAGLSHAAIVACAAAPVAGTSDTLQNFDAAGDGCARVNLSFENIVVSGSETGDSYVAPVSPNNNNMHVYSPNVAAPSGNSVNPISVVFGTETAGDWQASDNDADSLTINLSYVAVAHTGGTYSGPTSYPSPLAGYSWFFNTITPTLTGLAESGTGTNNIVMTTVFCLGANTTVGCTAANTGTIVYTIAEGSSTAAQTSCTVGANSSCVSGAVDINNNQYFTRIAFSTTVVASHGNANNVDVNLTNFGYSFTQFADTPEPSTFVLLSGAFLGLGLLHRRRQSRGGKI